MDEVIKPRNKALSTTEREKGHKQFYKRYGAWYFFNYKKSGRRTWIDQFDKQSNEDRQGW